MCIEIAFDSVQIHGTCELLFLWLLRNVPAAIQTSGRFDISVDGGKWSGQVQHAKVDLLRNIPPGEVGPHRRLLGPLLGTGYIPPAYRVCEGGGRGDESAVVCLSRLAQFEPLRGELFENGPPPVGDPASGVGAFGHGKFCQLLQYRRGRTQLLQAALCHSNAADLKCRQQLRSAGIRGLRGVVRKTASDDLQANIWDKQHMDKIVPSLLYNMHDADLVDDLGKKLPDLNNESNTSGGGGNEPASQEDLEETPCYLADSCLRELMGKASFGNIKCVVQPTLNHFDYHEMWTPPSFAVSCFEALMYSVQAQYSYLVIQAVIGHLDKHSNDAAEVRTGIATVLSRIVVIAANASIGPSLLEIFNSMLRHLRQSVDFQSHQPVKSGLLELANMVEPAPGDQERAYQDLLINTMGNFANNLPDYQKVEIMVFIISKVPLETSDRLADTFLQHVLTRTLLQVATKYKTGHLATVLTSTFLEPLLKLALVDDSGVRLLVQRILHTLLDRHGNLETLHQFAGVVPLAALKKARFTVEKCTRGDATFVQRCGKSLMSMLYKAALMKHNTAQNFDAIFFTMLLLFLEVGCEMVVVDLFRLVLAWQDLLMTVDVDHHQDGDDADDACNEHCFGEEKSQFEYMISKYVFLVSELMAMPALSQHAERLLVKCEQGKLFQQIDDRVDLPVRIPLSAEEDGTFSVDADSADLLPDVDVEHGCSLVEKQTLLDALKLRDYDTTRLNHAFSFNFINTQSSMFGSDSLDGRSMSMGSESGESSDSVKLRRLSRKLEPVLVHNGIAFPPTVDGLRQVLNQPTEYWLKQEEERCKQTIEMFQKLPFTELVEMQQRNSSNLNRTVERLLANVDQPDESKRTSTTKTGKLKFPELFTFGRLSRCIVM
ncbi:Protein EFR3 -like protein [Trichinella zimbabwensis]|uniref:Protein EFR3-like protein n=1 Tax=Trichinella zimbabwensis TaxID=268475 RepID=A0A0V1I0T8_9BILA|nr:Protein EFR3 -like protein [Trichinella zimbabwensis]